MNLKGGYEFSIKLDYIKLYRENSQLSGYY